MDTERIIFLLNNPSDATKEDFLLLEEAVKNYPYSQMLHTLLARIGNQIDAENKTTLLTTAAIYASDRTVLKEVLQSPGYLENIDEVPVYQDLPIVELKAEDGGMTFNDGETEQASDSSTIFDEVLKNLQKLKALREQFLFLEEDNDGDELIDSDQKKAGNVKTEDADKKEPIKKIKKGVKIPDKTRKKKIDQILKKDLELDTKVNAYFIAEITQKQEPVVPFTDKKSTQEEIIEKFIQEQPSIGSLRKELEKTPDEITKDLSEKSTKFGDNLVSENLAIILLKQGKKDRALDIYRKLIWKLPQKKAYFAARIEEIKK